MSLAASKVAWDVTTLKATTKLVLLAIADYAGGDGCAWAFNSTLAEKTGLSRASIKRHTRILARAGLVRIERRLIHGYWHDANNYILAPQFRDTQARKQAG